MGKRIIILGVVLSTVILLIPTMLVLAFQGEDVGKSNKIKLEDQTNSTVAVTDAEDLNISVFRAKTQKLETIDFENYIIGVVASEMPADFSIEALKAQALTARTYIIKHLLHPQTVDIPKGAVVTDTVSHQVYHSDEELRKLWGKDYEWKIAKIKEAVQKTRGEIITYEGTPITATFFSTSNGYTENSEDYWQNQFPYLRSVASPWDEQSPRYLGEKAISVQQFADRLGVQLSDKHTIGEILSRTQGGRVAEVMVAGKQFTGREIREKLDLDSSDFNWRRDGNQIIIETKGWGHGVGMSQYGANGLAREGKNYIEIIQYYYKDVDISSIESFINELTLL